MFGVCLVVEKESWMGYTYQVKIYNRRRKGICRPRFALFSRKTGSFNIENVLSATGLEGGDGAKAGPYLLCCEHAKGKGDNAQHTVVTIRPLQPLYSFYFYFFTFRIVPLGYLFVSSVSSVIWSRLRVRNKKVTDRCLGHTIGGAFAVSRVPAFHPHKSELVCFLLLLQRLVMWFSDEMLISCFAEHIKWS